MCPHCKSKLAGYRYDTTPHLTTTKWIVVCAFCGKHVTLNGDDMPTEPWIDLMKLKDELARFDGKPPYNTFSNPCVGDGYYAQALEEKYGRTLQQLRELLY